MPFNLDLRHILLGVLCAFLAGFVNLPPANAQGITLPAPGTLVHLSQAFNPPVFKGIKVHPENSLRFDFILDKGDTPLPDDQLKQESDKLIKYFLASLTIPEKDLWVNLSPYEKDRIVPDSFGKTEMGRDLLAQDYMLKQITASLIYPDDELGKQFWKRIYEQAAAKFGSAHVPVNTFNKVWIVPGKVVIYENAAAGTAYVVESTLKVMLEEDYLALSHVVVPAKAGTHSLASQVVREIIIPQLTKEVNEGANFAQLRQVYNSLILATWYKKKIKDSILSQVYADKNKVAGIVSLRGAEGAEAIYQKYLESFKKGAYNFIREEVDPITRQAIPRKYFSGGFAFGKIDNSMAVQDNLPETDGKNLANVSVDLAMAAKIKEIDLNTVKQSIESEFDGYLSPLEIKSWPKIDISYVPLEEDYINNEKDFFSTLRHFIENAILYSQNNAPVELNVSVQSDTVALSIVNKGGIDFGKLRLKALSYAEKGLFRKENGRFFITKNFGKPFSQAEVALLEPEDLLWTVGLSSLDQPFIEEKVKGGMGNGLKEGRRMIESAGGKLAIESSALETRVTISFPLAKPNPVTIESGEDLIAAKRAIVRSFLEQPGKIEGFKNTLRLIHDLKANKVPIAVGTSSSDSDLVLGSLGVAGMFNVVVSGKDIRNKTVPDKSDPAFYVEVAKRIGIAPENLAVFEDSQRGANSAVKAGMAFVTGLAREKGDRQRLEAVRVHHILDDIGELTVEELKTMFKEKTGRDLQGVIFDMDGVISDTEKYNFVAWKIVFGFFRPEIKDEFTIEEFGKYYSGASSRETVNKFLSLYGIELAQTRLEPLTEQEVEALAGQMMTPDSAGNAEKKLSSTGGIDFNSDKMDMQVQNNGKDIQFQIDPAMLRQLENAPGFKPVILNIQPMQDLQLFLGIKK